MKESRAQLTSDVYSSVSENGKGINLRKRQPNLQKGCYTSDDSTDIDEPPPKLNRKVQPEKNVPCTFMEHTSTLTDNTLGILQEPCPSHSALSIQHTDLRCTPSMPTASNCVPKEKEDDDVDRCFGITERREGTFLFIFGVLLLFFVSGALGSSIKKARRMQNLLCL
jgi:hypothetical protein